MNRDHEAYLRKAIRQADLRPSEREALSQLIDQSVKQRRGIERVKMRLDVLCQLCKVRTEMRISSQDDIGNAEWWCPRCGSIVSDHGGALSGFKSPACSILRPLEEYHEDYGAVLWWAFPVSEPPYVGSPLDDDWLGYHTHWTPIVPPGEPNL